MNIFKWFINSVLLVLFVLVLVTPKPKADPQAAYCSGQVLDVLVRTNGAICVKHSGSGSEWVCVPPDTDEAVKSRILSVLVTAYMSGKTVELKFSSGTCGLIPRWAHFDYVILKR